MWIQGELDCDQIPTCGNWIKHLNTGVGNKMYTSYGVSKLNLYNTFDGPFKGF